MLDDFRASYVLQYVPRGVAAEGWHDVSVAVRKHAGYEIRARKGLHIAHNFLITLAFGDELIAPMRKRMRPDRCDF